MTSSTFTKPIFEEPPDGLDENWHHGILVGGMAAADQGMTARSYKLAAEALLDQALASGDLSWELAYPVLFLYRHAAELHLKLVAPQHAKNHKLSDLIEQASLVHHRVVGTNLPVWVRERLLELASVDPTSTTFRYADDRARDSLQVLGESWVDLHRLRRVMNVILIGLSRLARQM